MLDIEDLVNKAKELHEILKEDMDQVAITSSSAGGAVKVTVNATKEVTKLEFGEGLPEDPQMLADVVLAALHGAYANVDSFMKEKVPGALKSMDITHIEDVFKK